MYPRSTSIAPPNRRSRLLFLFVLVATLMAAMLAAPLSTEAAPKLPQTAVACTGYEGLALGATFPVGAVFADNGVLMRTRPFQWSNGVWTNAGIAVVENGLAAGGAGQELEHNNINVQYRISPAPAAGIRLRFGEYGGNINVLVNGQFVNFNNMADINGAVIGGATVTVVNGFGNDSGVAWFIGEIHRFMIGGQEFYTDDVCIAN